MNDFLEGLKLLFSRPEEMNFVTLKFWIYFAVAYFLYAVIQSIKSDKMYFHVRSAYLLLFSLFLYYYTSGLFVGILLFSTLLDYSLGHLVYGSKKQLTRKLLIATSVIINLGVLCYFKYTEFFVDVLNDVRISWAALNQEDLPERWKVYNYLAEFGNSFTNSFFGEDGTFRVDKILLPVGISFYTFQTISYTVDIYRKEVKPLNSIVDFGFFVSFFPQLVAGPIVRARDFVPQIRQRPTIDKKIFGVALFMILRGFVKKKILGDYLAINFIDRVVDDPLMHSGFENLMAMYGYSLQIYADFSGYTDIAIGLAMMMGFRLPKNFNSPYKAINVSDFWRRWHLSLSHFLRDYLYIPLGGNRKGSVGSYILLTVIVMIFAMLTRFYPLLLIYPFIFTVLALISYYFPKMRQFLTTDINLIITMLLGGLWHGASMNFIIWGGLNGLGLIVFKHWKKISPYEKSNHFLVRAWKIFLTFNFITLTRVFFRSQDFDRSKGILNQIWNDFILQISSNKVLTNMIQVIEAYKVEFLVLLLGMIIHWLGTGIKNKVESTFVKTPIPLQFVVVLITVFMVLQLSDGSKPFVYFQF